MRNLFGKIDPCAQSLDEMSPLILKILQVDPKNERGMQYLRNLAYCYWHDGCFEKARKHYDMILQITQAEDKDYRRLLQDYFEKEPATKIILNLEHCFKKENNDHVLFDNFESLSPGYQKVVGRIYPNIVDRINSYADRARASY